MVPNSLRTKESKSVIKQYYTNNIYFQRLLPNNKYNVWTNWRHLVSVLSITPWTTGSQSFLDSHRTCRRWQSLRQQKALRPTNDVFLLAELHEVVDELVQLNLTVAILVDIFQKCLTLSLDLCLIHRLAGMFVVGGENSLNLTRGNRSVVVDIDLLERFRQRLLRFLWTARHNENCTPLVKPSERTVAQ